MRRWVRLLPLLPVRFRLLRRLIVRLFVSVLWCMLRLRARCIVRLPVVWLVFRAVIRSRWVVWVSMAIVGRVLSLTLVVATNLPMRLRVAAL